MRIHDYLDYWASRVPDSVCASDGVHVVTWAQMRSWTNRMSIWLERELPFGARFGVLSKNSLEIFAIYFAASRAGVVPVPLNARLAPPEWDFILRDSGAQLVVAEAEFTSQLDAVAAGGIEKRFSVGDGPHGWQSFADNVASEADEPCGRVVTSSDVLYQMYTSGTTGRPKGAVLTQGAITTNVVQLGTAMRFDRFSYLMVMPLFHAGAAITAFINVASGCSTRIVRDFDPAETLRILRDERIAATTLVPAMILALLREPGVRDAPFPDLRLIAYGSAPIASDVLKEAIEVFGCGFIQGYGMTELSATATVLEPEDHLQALASNPGLLLSAGRPLPGTEVRVVDAHGNPAPLGEAGEVVVRGPQVMEGYWNRPDATAEVLRDGWMHTGDVGRFDEDGYLYICDRVKDMIISGGENIYPREIEEVIFQMPEVADVTVIGVPDERWGEVATAFVIVRDGAQIDADSVLAHCRENLAKYKCPRAVEFVAEFPRNATGKVLKNELRDPYWKSRARAVN